MTTHSALIIGVAASSVSHLLVAVLFTAATPVNPNGFGFPINQMNMAKAVYSDRFTDVDLQTQKNASKNRNPDNETEVKTT